MNTRTLTKVTYTGVKNVLFVTHSTLGDRRAVPSLEQGVTFVSDCGCRQALCGPLRDRGVSVDDVEVFLESSRTPLPLSCDCFPLASSVLHVHCKLSTYSTLAIVP